MRIKHTDPVMSRAVHRQHKRRKLALNRSIARGGGGVKPLTKFVGYSILIRSYLFQYKGDSTVNDQTTKQTKTYELLTVDGDVLLSEFLFTPASDVPTLTADADVIIRLHSYPESALLNQICEQLQAPAHQEDLLKDKWIYVDFESAFPLSDERRGAFDRLFREGFRLQFPNADEAVRFVPLLASASQSKEYIYGFIRDDLFDGLRARLDLGFSFEEQFGTNLPLAYLAKLYGYRALYSSSATLAFSTTDSDAFVRSFFHEDSVLVLPEIHVNRNTFVDVYTAEQEISAQSNEVTLHPIHQKRRIDITCFDGTGILSKACHKALNKKLPPEMQGNSFQVRMPFFKGVLHYVDFHQFLKDHGVPENAMVKDVFGRLRPLYKAHVIVTPSVFKLYGLLKTPTPDVMRHYFINMRQYHHGLYVVKTERSFHNTTCATLNSQLVSTLDLSAEDWDGLIGDHCAAADAYCPRNLLDPVGKKSLEKNQNRDAWMSLLMTEPTFLRDPTIQTMLKNHRTSRYNNIALGRVNVIGENRFLCGDLLYLLYRLLCHAGKGNTSIKRRCIPRGAVYLPNNGKTPQPIALLRNPHLSRNECVYANRLKPKFAHYLDRYLGHLTGVVFVGHCSCIPKALGGADFDGDHVIVCYDDRIVNACRKSGYSEACGTPFIDIPALASKNVCTVMGRYVSPQVVYNTFSNRIGYISNAAMKLAAVEYDTTLPVCDKLPSAAFGTILTGTEIDGSKKGVRPNINAVVRYNGNEDPTHQAVVEQVELFIDSKKDSKSLKGRRPQTSRGENGALCWKGKVLHPNREHNPVTQLLYRWASTFEDFSELPDEPLIESLPPLDSIFPEENPVRGTTAKILNAYTDAAKDYHAKQKNRRDAKDNCNENNKKLLTRLKGQYDACDMPLIREKANALQHALLLLARRHGEGALRSLRDRVFALSETQPFDADAFWPYDNALSDPLLDEILALPHADLLTQFRFEGYRLLFYCLDNALSLLNVQETTPQKDNNPYKTAYLRFAADRFAEVSSDGDPESNKAFDRRLAKKAIEDLKAVLFVDNELDVIRRLYPPKTQDQKKAFWEIFTPGQVLEALGGDNHAE